MASSDLTLAIEMSGATGSIALAQGSQLLAVVDLPRRRRHDLSLARTLQGLLASQNMPPQAIGQIVLSTGPGAFTALRIAVVTARMLAMSLGARIVAVPTMRLWLHAAATMDLDRAQPLLLAVQWKKARAYGGLFRFHEPTACWQPVGAAREDDLQSLAGDQGGPLTLVMPEAFAVADQRQGLDPDWKLQVMDPTLVRADALWRAVQPDIEQGAFVDPMQLVPEYGREPEAVTLWRKRHEG